MKYLVSTLYKVPLSSCALIPRSAMPFDWTFSSPAMVRDCLDDDFRAFLDPREYIAIGKRGTRVKRFRNQVEEATMEGYAKQT